MERKVIATDKAPGAIGPYSQGISIGELIYTSGQLPIDAATGEFEVNDIKKATRHCLDNLKAILEAGGASMDDIVKAMIFLTDMDDFAAVNEVYATYFKSTPPARSCVSVAKLPRGAKVEIEAVAARR